MKAGYAVAGLLVCMVLLQAGCSAGMPMMHTPSSSPPPPRAGPAPSPSPVVTGSNPIRADATLARKAYPWCKTAVTTSYALESIVQTVTNSSGSQEFVFAMREDFGACLDYMRSKGRSNETCLTPFYSFMIAIAEDCHEAVMIVNTVQLVMREDKPSANASAMYCHSHKGHDTGVPLLKFLAKPTYLMPKTTAPYARRRFTFRMRVNPRDEDQMHCADIRHLCGGEKCMVALSDEEYDVCPAFFARIV